MDTKKNLKWEDVKITILDRREPISDSRRRLLTIEEIRQQIVDKADRKIQIGKCKGGLRASIYRGMFKVSVIAFPEGAKYTEKEAREIVIEKILAGELDQQITEEYEQLRAHDREMRARARLGSALAEETKDE